MDGDKSHSDLVVQCECGTLWLLDYAPVPEKCNGAVWRLGIFLPEEGIDWGSWVDYEGNNVELVNGLPERSDHWRNQYSW